MKSLEVVPNESVTFLPLLSSLDIRVFNNLASQSLLYFGPVGSFASTVKTRWKGTILSAWRGLLDAALLCIHGI
ncbi:hypothetical protein BDZ89DRAFT_1116784 [Hymenopellis radicata]|nr:hypothetical protein BDZ89DRAFT_1116784 [Hymenopellis radicata]